MHPKAVLFEFHHNAIRIRLLFLWAFHDLFARLDYEMLCSSAKVKEKNMLNNV